MLVHLHVRRPVEVRLDRGQPGRPGIVGEHPAHRVGRREHPAAAGPQHPGHLAHRARRVGDERDRAERREGEVETAVRRTAARRRRPAPAAPSMPGAAGGRPGVRQHPGGQVEGDHRRALAGPGTARTAPTRSRPRAPAARATSPSRCDVGFAQVLRAPDEVGVAEELAVLGVVGVGVGVPPAPVRGPRRPPGRRARLRGRVGPIDAARTVASPARPGVGPAVAPTGVQRSVGTLGVTGHRAAIDRADRRLPSRGTAAVYPIGWSCRTLERALWVCAVSEWSRPHSSGHRPCIASNVAGASPSQGVVQVARMKSAPPRADRHRIWPARPPGSRPRSQHPTLRSTPPHVHPYRHRPAGRDQRHRVG